LWNIQLRVKRFEAAGRSGMLEKAGCPQRVPSLASVQASPHPR